MEKDITFLPDDFEFAAKQTEDQAAAVKSDGMLVAVLKRFWDIKSARAGVIAIGVIVFLAIFGPFMSAFKYDELIVETVDGVTYTASNVAPTLSYEGQNGAFEGYVFILGTDNLGRDLWTRIWRGTRVSLLVALVAIIINLAVGLPIGLIAGYKGGMTDSVIQRISEVLNSIPILVVISILAVFMPKGVWLVILALAITGWVGISRITRAATLSVKEMEYVYASRTLGTPTGRILRRTIFPNTVGPIITNLLFAIPGAIFTEAFLSFVGVGITPPDCSLGALMEQGFENMSIYPFQLAPAVLILAVLMISFNAIGEGVEKALAPGVADV